MSLNNRRTRIIVSFLTIPVIVVIALIGKIPFLIFALSISLLSYYEFHGMAKQKNADSNLLLGLTSVTIIIINAYWEFIDWKVLLLILTLMIFITELFRNQGSAVYNAGSTFFGILYLGLFGASIVHIREYYSDYTLIYDNGGFLIVSILAAIWICDSAAYFLGSAFGKHKLFLRVSPNKTWEGAVSGFIFAILSMLAAKIIILDFFSWIDVIVIGIIIGVIGQVGDLVESLIKRDCDVKDSSSLIPGHGGIFDRFDSFLFSSPVIYLYMHFFLL